LVEPWNWSRTSICPEAGQKIKKEVTSIVINVEFGQTDAAEKYNFRLDNKKALSTLSSTVGWSFAWQNLKAINMDSCCLLNSRQLDQCLNRWKLSTVGG
jgi:hypothetical protein